MTTSGEARTHADWEWVDKVVVICALFDSPMCDVVRVCVYTPVSPRQAGTETGQSREDLTTLPTDPPTHRPVSTLKYLPNEKSVRGKIITELICLPFIKISPALYKVSPL